MSRARLLAVLVALLLPSLLAAQTPAAQFIAQARQQLEDLNPDSAASLLRYAVDPRTGAGVRERLRGFTLLGIADLMSGRRPDARRAFRDALSLDPELRVDSLAFLHSDLLSTFEAERATLARARGLSLVTEIPADTSVPVQGGGFRVAVLPTRQAAVVLTVLRESGGAPLFRDSQVVSGVASFDWNLRTEGGRMVEPGRYSLRITAVDSAGERASPVERTLLVEAEPLDTVPLPAALPRSAFEAESVRVRGRAAPVLLKGLLFGGAAAVLAHAGPGPGGARDTRAYGVAGVMSLAGVVGFVRGRPQVRADADAAERNRQLLERDAQNRAAIVQANLRARERARIRVRLAGRPS